MINRLLEDMKWKTWNGKWIWHEVLFDIAFIASLALIIAAAVYYGKS